MHRKIDLCLSGGKVEQETLRWDDISCKTVVMRDKENAQDYRYFPDPDLVAIRLSDEYIDGLALTDDVLEKWKIYINKKECYVAEYQNHIHC